MSRSDTQSFFQPPKYDFPTIWEKLSQALRGYFLFSSFQVDTDDDGNCSIMFISAMHLLFPNSLFEFEVLINGNMEEEDFVEYAKNILLGEYIDYIEDAQERIQNLARPSALER